MNCIHCDGEMEQNGNVFHCLNVEGFETEAEALAYDAIHPDPDSEILGWMDIECVGYEVDVDSSILEHATDKDDG